MGPSTLTPPSTNTVVEAPASTVSGKYSISSPDSCGPSGKESVHLGFVETDWIGNLDDSLNADPKEAEGSEFKTPKEDAIVISSDSDAEDAIKDNKKLRPFCDYCFGCCGNFISRVGTPLFLEGVECSGYRRYLKTQGTRGISLRSVGGVAENWREM